MAPNPPTSLFVTATEVGKLYLDWAAPAVLEVPAEYWIYSGISVESLTGTTVEAMIGTDATDYISPALGNGVTRYYIVYTATDIGGTNELSATGAGPSVGTTWSVPNPPTALTVTATEVGVLYLGWTAPAFGDHIVQYDIWGGAASADGYLGSVDNLVTNYADLALGDGTTRHYKVFASNEVGTEVTGTLEVEGTTWDVPDAPTDLTVTATEVNVLYLHWHAPLAGDHVVQYDIWAGDLTAAAYIASVSSAVTNYAELSLADGQTRHYQVFAANQVGTEVTGTLEEEGTVWDHADAPTDLLATPGLKKIILTWVAPVDVHGAAVTGYKIYTEAGATLLATVGNVLTYTQTGMGDGVLEDYELAAINAVGDSVRSTSDSATTWNVPNVPKNLAVTATEVGKLYLTWVVPDVAIEVPAKYRIYAGDISGTLTFKADVGTDVLEYTEGSLTNGKTRFYQVVTATNVVAPGSGDESEPTDEETGTTWDVPDAPTGLTVTATEVGVLYLGWTAPAGGDHVTRYDVWAGVASASAYIGSTISSVTNYADLAIGNGTTKHYKIFAGNEVGTEVTGSSEEEGTTWDVPAAPTTLTATAGLGKITLDWTAPAAVGTPLVQYNVYSGTGGTFTNLIDTVASPTVTYDATVGSGVTVYYKVSAENIVEEGALSNDAGATAFAVPDAPVLVSATGGLEKITLVWTAPADNGGSAITAYTVYSGTGGTFTTLVDTVSGVTLTYDVVLGSGVTGYYKVSASNVAGEGALSNDLGATTFAVPSVPLNLTVGRDIRHLDLAWEVPASNGGTPILSYNIYTESGVVENLQAVVIFPTTTHIDNYGMSNGETRIYKVSANNAAGEGLKTGSETGETYNIPSQPTGFTVGSGANQLTLDWGVPVSDGGLAITVYNIYAGDTTGVLTYTENVPAGTYTFTETGLADDRLRFYQVSAVNAAGEGVLTAEMNGTTYHVPGAPTGLTIGSGVRELVLTWVAPVDIGGLAITKYTIYAGTASTFEVEVGTVSGVVLTYTETGLTNNQTRFYQVSATNSEGESARSGERSGVTYDIPDEPTGLTIGSGVRELVLTWVAPVYVGRTPITNYKVYVGTVVIATVGDVLTYTNTGLANNQTVTYTVSAVNIAGEGDPSAAVSGLTYDVPGAPTVLSIEFGDTQAYIESWIAPVYTGRTPITNYKIYRGLSDLTTTTLVATVSATIGPYLDSGLTNGVVYYYKVSAVNAAGEGAKSVEAHGLVTAAPVTLTNQYLFNAESLREFIFNLSGAGTYVIPIPTNYLVLSMIATFSGEHNVNASTYILVDKTVTALHPLPTVSVFDALATPPAISPLEFDISLIVYCRDKLFQNDNAP